MELENIWQNIPGQLEQELFDNLLETPGLRVERIVSKGHQSPASGWYDQNSNEWVTFHCSSSFPNKIHFMALC